MSSFSIGGEMSHQKILNHSFSEGEFFSVNVCQGQSAIKENVFQLRKELQLKSNLTDLKNSESTYIIFEVGPENTILSAQKNVLACENPVFNAMFYGPLAEKGNTVIIPDIMPDGFQNLLRYLNGDSAVITTATEAQNTWIAAEKYIIPDLKKKCEDYFRNCDITSSNIWSLFDFAVYFKIKTLLLSCRGYLEDHIELSFCNDDFLETKTEIIKEIFNISSLRVCKYLLFHSVIRWGRHKVDAGVAVSLKEALKPFLPHICFGALTTTEFCQFTDITDDLLESSDAYAILKHLTLPKTYALPNWCSVRNVPLIHLTRASIMSAFKLFQEKRNARKCQKSPLLLNFKNYKHTLNCIERTRKLFQRKNIRKPA